MNVKKSAVAGFIYKNRRYVPKKARRFVYAASVALIIAVILMFIGFVTLLSWIVDSL